MIGLLMDPHDNVAVVTQNVKKGDPVYVEGTSYTAAEDIPVGHKMALRSISNGEMIYKYGKVIGRASADIFTGNWVHCHNVEDITETLREEYAKHYRAGEEE